MNGNLEQFVLRSASTANGDSEEVRIEKSGLYRYFAYGTWNSGTLSLNLKPLNIPAFSIYKDVPSASSAVFAGTGTESLTMAVYLSEGDVVKDALANAGVSTSLYSTLSRIHMGN